MIAALADRSAFLPFQPARNGQICNVALVRTSSCFHGTTRDALRALASVDPRHTHPCGIVCSFTFEGVGSRRDASTTVLAFSEGFARCQAIRELPPEDQAVAGIALAHVVGDWRLNELIRNELPGSQGVLRFRDSISVTCLQGGLVIKQGPISLPETIARSGSADQVSANFLVASAGHDSAHDELAFRAQSCRLIEEMIFQHSQGAIRRRSVEDRLAAPRHQVRLMMADGA